VLTFMGFVTPAERLLAILRWPILLAVVGVWLAVIYRYSPSRRDPQWRWVTWGSAIAAVLWLVASMLFSWYVANFDSYNKTYGSLGAGVDGGSRRCVACLTQVRPPWPEIRPDPPA
jgi:membrane protein